MSNTLTAEEQKKFIDSLSYNLSKEQLNTLRIFIRQTNESYHKAKVESEIKRLNSQYLIVFSNKKAIQTKIDTLQKLLEQ